MQSLRLIEPIRRWLFLASGTGLLLAVTYTVVFGTFSPTQQAALFLLFALPAAFCKLPLIKLRGTRLDWWVLAGDLILAVAGLWAAGHICFGFEAFTLRLSTFAIGVQDIMAGMILAILLLETVRRYLGWPLVIVAGIATLYLVFGHSLPGALASAPIGLIPFASSVLLGSGGIFGPALQVTSTAIYGFLLFGVLLEKCGFGMYVTRIAEGFTRGRYGGEAKACVIGSSLMGMVTGSAVANISTVGTITIPIMIKAGFNRVVAASIEAIASSGGQIMPPIMGATAFVIAAYTGIPYRDIALGALMPALLFYLSIYLNVHFYARRHDIRSSDTKEMSRSWRWSDTLAFTAIALPMVLLVYLLVTTFPIMLTAFIAAGALIVASFPFKKLRISISKALAAVGSLTSSIVMIGAACGAAGLVMGAIMQSGLGAELSSFLVDASGGSTFVLALYTAIACIILGCGLPTVVVYIVVATLVAPALIAGGISVLAAHLFVFYYGVIGLLTPPLAIAAYTAAAIAQSEPNKTGWYAAWFAMGKYVVPFMFLFSPALVGQGSLEEIAVKFSFGVVAMAAVSITVVGYAFRRLALWERAGYLACVVLLAAPWLLFNVSGLGGFAALMVMCAATRRSGSKRALSSHRGS